MFQLVSTGEYVLVFVLAAVSGLFGGLAFELMQTRRGGTGRIERPWKVGQTSYFDVGFAASLFVGAVAAVAALYVFPPRIDIVITNAAGETTMSSGYEVVKLVALSLIVGSAGSSILAGLQQRVLAAVNAQQAKNAQSVAKAGLDGLAAQAADEAKRTVTDALAAKAGSANRELIESDVPTIADEIARQMQARMDAQVDTIKKVIEAGTRLGDVQDG
jgi:hypothetical protein